MNLLLLLSVASGCAAYDAAKAEDGSFDSASGATTDADSSGSPTDTTTSDTALPLSPAWYAVDATLTVLGGFPVGSPGAVSLTVVDADLARVACTVPLDTSALGAGPPGTSTVWLWWTLPVTPVEESCASLPETISLGLGELVPDVRAELGAVGLDQASDALYGAYLLADGASNVTFGVGATEAGFDGEGAAGQPVPDGTYTLQTLFLVPLPG